MKNKGGSGLSVLETAIVPFGLWGMQKLARKSKKRRTLRKATKKVGRKVKKTVSNVSKRLKRTGKKVKRNLVKTIKNPFKLLRPKRRRRRRRSSKK